MTSFSNMFWATALPCAAMDKTTTTTSAFLIRPINGAQPLSILVNRPDVDNACQQHEKKKRQVKDVPE